MAPKIFIVDDEMVLNLSTSHFFYEHNKRLDSVNHPKKIAENASGKSDFLMKRTTAGWTF